MSAAERTLLAWDARGVWDSCHKIWSPRGLYRERGEQNSVEAFRRAFSAGARGAEVDVHYDVSSDRFVVAHDHPVEDEAGRLVYTRAGGRLLTLEELFAAVGDEHSFWIDFKNLDRLSAAETGRAIARLLRLTEAGGLRDRCYVEGSNPLRLADYGDAGLRTILGIHPPPESRWYSSAVLDAYTVALWLSRASGVALAYGPKDDPQYGEEAARRLGRVPVFLFHVPDDRELLEDLVGRPEVRVVLVGKGVSTDRFAITACPELPPPVTQAGTSRQ